MKKLKVGLIGTGFIGNVHIDAIMRSPYAELAAICDSNLGAAEKLAARYDVAKVYGDYQTLLNDPDIDVIHNCTPNHLHFQINRAALENGKNLFCEKPLSLDTQESAQLYQLTVEHPECVTGMNFNYRMYPMVQKYKNLLADRKLGRPLLVHGRFLQDWMLYETDYNWRLHPEYSGASRAVADIGSHWCDVAQTLLGSLITEVCADLAIILPERINPQSERVPIQTEDYATVMVRFANGTQGVFYVSQVSAGHKCDLSLEIDTDTCSITWEHQRCEEVRIGHRDGGDVIDLRGSSISGKTDQQELPAGHPEGFNDAVSANVNAYYRKILDPTQATAFATLKDGHQMMLLVEAILASYHQRKWIAVKYV